MGKAPTTALKVAIAKVPVRQSSNRDIGILPPGKILNDDLFDQPGERDKALVLKKDLQLGKDYLMVNNSVWQRLRTIYGGGPEIARKAEDIYSQAVGEDLDQPFSPLFKVNRRSNNENLNQTAVIEKQSSFNMFGADKARVAKPAKKLNKNMLNQT